MAKAEKTPAYKASEDPDWAEFDDRITEDTKEGRITTWTGEVKDDDGDKKPKAAK